MFKYLSTKEFEALSEYQQEKYLDDKRKHEQKIAKEDAEKAGQEAAEKAVATVKEELTGTIDAQKKEIEALTVKLDESDKKVEEKMAEMSRIRIAAKENELKGDFFDVALGKAMEEAEDDLKKLATDKNAKIKLTLKDVGTMGISSIADISMANAQLRPGIISLPNRRVHMRNIMNTGRMTTSDFHYLRETGGEGDVDTWGENTGNKPTLDLDYIEKVAPSQFIAGTLDISRKSLDDIPALRSALGPRLLEKYLIKEDQQILSGSGVSPQIEGILEVAEAYDEANGYTRLVERIIDAIGQLEENEFYADGVIIKPRDWAIVANTVSNGDEQVFTLPGLGIVSMQNGILYINGVPVYKMNGMPTSPRQFLVGDWMLGAQLLIREDPTVEFSYENNLNFVQNKITVRVEGRVALPIYFEDAFVEGAVTPTT